MYVMIENISMTESTNKRKKNNMSKWEAPKTVTAD